MPDNEFSLQNLTSHELSTNVVRGGIAHFQADLHSYYKRYGKEEGYRRFCEDHAERNRKSIRQMMNERIYATGEVVDEFNPVASDQKRARFEARLRELYGSQYDEIVRDRVWYDPRVAELLLQEAVRTGVWDELPKSLQEEYWKRVGDNT